MSTSLILRGTPVVPGVAYAPVVTATVAVSPAAVAAFESAGFPDADAALAAYDVAVRATAEGLAARADRASGDRGRPSRTGRRLRLPARTVGVVDLPAGADPRRR